MAKIATKVKDLDSNREFTIVVEKTDDENDIVYQIEIQKLVAKCAVDIAKSLGFRVTGLK